MKLLYVLAGFDLVRSVQITSDPGQLITDLGQFTNGLLASNKLRAHGCHCSKFDDEPNVTGGSPIDACDVDCRDVQRKMKCLVQPGGACHPGGINFLSYPVAMNGGKFFDNAAQHCAPNVGDKCKMAVCEIIHEFGSALMTKVSNGHLKNNWGGWDFNAQCQPQPGDGPHCPGNIVIPPLPEIPVAGPHPIYIYMGCFIDQAARDMAHYFRIPLLQQFREIIANAGKNRGQGRKRGKRAATSDGRSWASIMKKPMNAVEWCAVNCRRRKYRFAAVQKGQHCFCDDSYGDSGIDYNEGSCDTPCHGRRTADDELRCGGNWRNSVYDCQPKEPTVINTPNRYTYKHAVKIHDFNNDFIKFKVKANNDAHVLLTTGHGEEVNKMFEIVLGGWTNTQSVIRTGKQTRNLVTKRGEPKALDRNAFTSYAVVWAGEDLVVWRGDDSSDGYTKFMTLTGWKGHVGGADADIENVGVSTGWGSTGVWEF